MIEGKLYGFTVYDRITGDPVEHADHYLITPDGFLLKSYYAGDSRLEYKVVEPEGKLIVQYGSGDTEVY